MSLSKEMNKLNIKLCKKSILSNSILAFVLFVFLVVTYCFYPQLKYLNIGVGIICIGQCLIEVQQQRKNLKRYKKEATDERNTI